MMVKSEYFLEGYKLAVTEGSVAEAVVEDGILNDSA